MSKSENYFGKFTAFLVLLVFFSLCYLVVSRQVAESQVVRDMLNALLLMSGAAFQYLCGSSSGSRAKDRAIADLTKAKGEEQP